MSKSVYCVDKIDEGKKEMITAENKNTPAKRINIVSIKMVREATILYNIRKITSPADAVELGKKILENSDREHLWLLCLDTKNQPVALNEVSVGSLSCSIVHPREVFKAAILSNAASIILFHNHPSGDPSASNEDIKITTRLKECGEILGVPLIDHIIIGNEKYCSLKEKGIL
ncbi:JAB domain-containing protein [Clostridium bowmanii]|uniref:JAB domain-containing protein n=1 Tax=Clostridium bowmanii TaxID=132925 RepID=UPI0028AD0A36|nr:JAB domain-containing protein [Clostridium bowmanii]